MKIISPNQFGYLSFFTKDSSAIFKASNLFQIQ